jgi:hypothetical protein
MTTLASRRLALHQSFLQNNIRNSQTRSFTASTIAMAKFDINSKVKLNSGEEIPRLGFGKFLN